MSWISPCVRWGGTGGTPEPVEGTLLWPPEGDAVFEGAALNCGFDAGPASMHREALLSEQHNCDI